MSRRYDIHKDSIVGGNSLTYILIIASLLILTTSVTYFPVLGHDFVIYDDGRYVNKNEMVLDGLTFANIKQAFISLQASNWHPFTWLSHMMDVELYGFNPMGHHLTNIILHIGNTLILFFLFQKMTGAIYQSALVAALFALHPMHVESVAWVAERKDVLSTFFGLLALLAYHNYVKYPGIWRYLTIFLLLCLSLMAKAMLVTLPLLLLLFDFWPMNRSNLYQGVQSQNSTPSIIDCQVISRLIFEKLPFFVPVLLTAYFTIIAQYQRGAVQSLNDFPIVSRALNACSVIIKYVEKALWPNKMAVFYPYAVNSLSVFQILIAIVILGSVLFIGFRLYRSHPYIIFGELWFLITLIPVLGFVQVGPQAMADRYTYVPYIGLFVIFSWGLWEAISRFKHAQRIFIITSVAIVTALMIRTTNQVKVWKNSTTLFKNAIEMTENNWLAHNNLGTVYFNDKNYDQAIQHFIEALVIRPDYFPALQNLGSAMVKKGKNNEAIRCFSKILKISPENEDALFSLGNLYYENGKYKISANYFQQVIRINPVNIGAWMNLGNTYFALNWLDESIESYHRALDIDPENVGVYNNLANVLQINGNINQAIMHYKRAIEINPAYEDGHYNLANLYLKSGRFDESYDYFHKVLKINQNHSGAKQGVQRIQVLKMEQLPR